MYVLIRIDQGGGYVARSGNRQGASYTKRLEEAQTFRTREEAVANSCPENECALSLEECMR